MTTKVPVELSSTPGIVDGSNATAITIDSSENVGIGTSSISSSAGWGTLLEVSGTTNAGIKLTETDTANGDYSLGVTAGTFRIWDEAASAFRVTLESNGNITSGGANASVFTGTSSVSLADDATYAISTQGTATGGGALLCVYEVGSGDNALFHIGYNGAAIISTANNAYGFAVADTDSKICVTKSGHAITFKNRTGGTRTFYLAVYGAGNLLYNL